jgi:hypothetical protein
MRWRELLRHLNAPSRRQSALPARLIECRQCGSGFVNPVDWQACDAAYWWIRLRCGECGLVREAFVTNEDAARFERELDRGVAEIAAAVARLERGGAPECVPAYMPPPTEHPNRSPRTTEQEAP